MQHGKEPALVAPLYRGRPGIGTGGRRMPGEVKDVHDAFPHCSAVMRFFDGHSLDKRSPAAVLGFDGAFKLVGADFVHGLPIIAVLLFRCAIFPHYASPPLGQPWQAGLELRATEVGASVAQSVNRLAPFQECVRNVAMHDSWLEQTAPMCLTLLKERLSLPCARAIAGHLHRQITIENDDASDCLSAASGSFGAILRAPQEQGGHTPNHLSTFRSRQVA